MKPLLTVFTGALLTFGQFGCSVFGVRTLDEPNYTLLKSAKNENIEIRQYSEFLVAETQVESRYEDASRVGFRRLFRFISGDNTSQQKIAMTAPVQRSRSGEEIAMTAPVFQEQDKSWWTVSFVMPAKFTSKTVPQPTDSTVTIRTVASRKVAVISFRGRIHEDGMEEYAQTLRAWCKNHGYRLMSEPRLAGYDPPYTLPFLRRNEVHIDVDPLP